MRQVLVFRLGDRQCGLDVVRLREILEAPRCHYIPRAPAWCEGAIDVQGQVMPVIDLPALLGQSGERRDHRCIVLDVPPGQLALRVTAISRILPVEEDAVLLPAEDDLLAGLLPFDDVRLEILDTNALLQRVQQFMGD